MATPDIEPQSIRNLDEWKRKWVPSVEVRMYRQVGDDVRLWVRVNGLMSEYPWVRITEVTETGYVGAATADFEATPGFRVERGTVIKFTADHIVDY